MRKVYRVFRVGGTRRTHRTGELQRAAQDAGCGGGRPPRDGWCGDPRTVWHKMEISFDLQSTPFLGRIPRFPLKNERKNPLDETLFAGTFGAMWLRVVESGKKRVGRLGLDPGQSKDARRVQMDGDPEQRRASNRCC